MKNILLFILGSFSFFLSLGQDQIDSQPDKVLDSLYREDQFYVGLTYNLLLDRPRTISQSGFSGGLHLGFIRDMPINKRRNVAIGLGIGYSLNVFNHNLFIRREGGVEQATFSSLEGTNFGTNRFTTHLVEAPLEFRWRTSIPDTHKFYRIYTGFKLGYMHSFSARFKGDLGEVRETKINELDRWRMGVTFTFGWNTFNFHFYYSLNSLFSDEALIEGRTVGITPARVGLIFYIL